ncbi:MAG: alpha-L-arabinofuranosidase C-terminal domain-containing protein [Bacteroidales bacterium]
MNIKAILGAVLLLCLSVPPVRSYGQSPVSLTVDADRPLHPIQPTMWGLFFEDINFAADGGLYAELVKNRSFEFPDPREGWVIEGASLFHTPVLFVNRSEEGSNNPRVARIRVDSTVCMMNRGFRGMGIHGDDPYRISLLASVISGDVKIVVKLLAKDGTEIGNTVLHPTGNSWQKVEAVFKANSTDPKASLKLCFEGRGILEVDMISLFPVNTWKKRPNGLRADLVQLLADLEPGFLRFPGGCIVEGRDLSKRYRWKNTVGNVEDRKILINRWNDENSRATPDYFQSFGLGFYEFFLLSEDIGAEPVPILNCGMACQFNTAELAAMEDLEPYLQDALDLIEFANGPTDSRWGSLRAEMGHPEPFQVKYLGIGNEQWGPQYFERYARFEALLVQKHPEIELISGTGPFASGPGFEYNSGELKKFNPALVDEHYYNTPDWFFDNVNRYDAYDRDSYKIFAGEYAAANVGMASPDNRNVWITALAEAAYMTGLERNSDVVYMASYAPLLAHTEAWQWTPDLIWFDNLIAYGTPNYYVQKLVATHRGTHLLGIHREGGDITGEDGLYASSVWDETSGEVIVKLVSNNDHPVPVRLSIETDRILSPSATATVLSSNDLSAMNSIAEPENMVPVNHTLHMRGENLELQLDPYSLTIVTIGQSTDPR